MDALARWPTAPEISEVERSALAYAQQYVLDPHGMTDDTFATLRARLDARAIATLTLAIVVFDARVRVRLALGIAPASDPGPSPLPTPATTSLP